MPGVLPRLNSDEQMQDGGAFPPDYSKVFDWNAVADAARPEHMCDEERLLTVYKHLSDLYAMVRASAAGSKIHVPVSWHSEVDREERDLKKIKGALKSLRSKKNTADAAIKSHSNSMGLVDRLCLYHMMFQYHLAVRQVAYLRRFWSTTLMFPIGGNVQGGGDRYVKLPDGRDGQWHDHPCAKRACWLIVAAMICLDAFVYPKATACSMLAVASALFSLDRFVRRDASRCHLKQLAKQGYEYVVYCGCYSILLAVFTFNCVLFILNYPLVVSLIVALALVWIVLDDFVVMEPSHAETYLLAMMVLIICVLVFQAFPGLLYVACALAAICFVLQDIKGSKGWRELVSCEVARKAYLVPGKSLCKIVRLWARYRDAVARLLTTRRFLTFSTCQQFMAGGWRYPVVPYYKDKSPKEICAALNNGQLCSGGMCIFTYGPNTFAAYRSDYEQTALQVFGVRGKCKAARLHVKLQECRVSRRAEHALAKRIHDLSIWSVELNDIPDFFHWKEFRHHAVWRMLGGAKRENDGTLSGVRSSQTATHLAVYLNELMYCLNSHANGWDKAAMNNWTAGLDAATDPLELACLGADIHRQAGRVSSYRTFSDFEQAVRGYTGKLRSDANSIEALTHEGGGFKVGAGATEAVGGVIAGVGVALAAFTCGASLAVTAVGCAVGAAGGIVGAVADPILDKKIKAANEEAMKELKSATAKRLVREVHTLVVSMQFVGFAMQVQKRFSDSDLGKQIEKDISDAVKAAHDLMKDAEREEEKEDKWSWIETLKEVGECIEALTKGVKAVQLTALSIKYVTTFGKVAPEVAEIITKTLLPAVTRTTVVTTVLEGAASVLAGARVAGAARAGGDVLEMADAVVTAGKSVTTANELRETTEEAFEALEGTEEVAEGAGEAANLGAEVAEAGEGAAEAGGKALAGAASTASKAVAGIGVAIDVVMGVIGICKGIEELKSDGGKVAEAARKTADGFDESLGSLEHFWPNGS